MKVCEAPAIAPIGSQGDAEGVSKERATDIWMATPLKETGSHATGVDPRHATTHPLRLAPD
jgi:hypothetical protein